MNKGISKLGIVVMGLMLGTGWIRADQTPQDSLMQGMESVAGQTLTIGNASNNTPLSHPDGLQSTGKKSKSHKSSKTKKAKKTKTTKIKRSTSKKSKTKKSRKKSV